MDAVIKQYFYRKYAAIMYIYERKAWPRFTWDAGAIGARLGEIRHRQGRILGQMEGLGFSVREETMLRAITLDVLKSTEIEGELLNPDKVRFSIARRLGIEITETVQADRSVEGVVEMMLDATQHYDKPLTAERLFGWQAALFPTGQSGIYKIKIAGWRDGGMQVTSWAMGREIVHFDAPGAYKVPQEINGFLKWLEDRQDLDAVLKAAVAHLWFVTIHPFDDGNGRIARAIADLQLARADKSQQRFYSMSAQIQAERKMYYDILESTQKGDVDITPWLEWFLDCLMRSMDQTNEIIVSTRTRARFWETRRDTEFNTRQHKILGMLLDDFFGKLHAAKYAAITNTSTDTALRDLQDLVKKGVLEQQGSGRATSYRLV